ncbi:hypothetical protein, partial [Phaeobacter gallaeciensis]|uniref:hypothetical protein n=1 Tax=Phaeobacter gallaeciensis TaxID=60890 RepID=UPI00237F51C1
MSNTTKNPDRTALIVLGMHRSGTSALAGVLNLLGCDEPNTLMVPNENNTKGYFESSELYQLHTQLFASAATRWDDWLPMPEGWFTGPRAAEFHDRAIETVYDEFGKSRLFLVKDPRICRLVPFWEGVLREIDALPRYVLTIRNPLEVAASLHKRDRLSIGQGLLIWLRHVIDAEHDTRGRPRCFTSYAQLMTNWASVADKIQTELDLRLPRFSLGVAGEVDTFLEDTLHHHHEQSEKVLQNPMLSTWIRDTYEILSRWVVDGEEDTDHVRLDAIRTAFNASAPAFAQAMQDAHTEATRFSGEIEQLSNELDAVKNDKMTLAAQLEDQSNQLTQKESALEQRTRQIEETRVTLEKLRTELTERERSHAETLATSTQEADKLLEFQDRLTAEIQDLRSQLSGAQSALEQRSHEAEETYKTLEALRAETTKLEQEHKALQRKHLEDKEERDHLRDQNTLLQGEIAAKAEQVQTLETSLQDQYREQAEISQIVADKEMELERERSARVSAAARSAELDNRVQTQLREISDLSRLLAQSEQALTTAQVQSQGELAAALTRIEEAETRAVQVRTSSEEKEMELERERSARVSAAARSAELDNRV